MNTTNNIYRTWVIDPSNLDLSSHYSLIDKLIKNSPDTFKFISQTNLSNGLVKYKYIITDPYNSSYNSLIQVLSDVSYDPLVISMPIEDSESIETSLSIKEAVKSILNIDVRIH